MSYGPHTRNQYDEHKQVIEKDLGAQSAAAVDTAGSSAREAAPHVAHTPGPWHVSQWHEPRGGVVPCVVAGPATIAKLHVAPITREPEALANAHLIAAAPEMKEALLKIRASLAINQSALAVAIIATCDAAIAKAEGR